LPGITDPAVHSKIQDNQAALNATQLALKLSKKYQRRLHILHLSTAEEAELLRQDKPSWVTAEVTPQHLLLNTTAYEKIGTLAQMNPPLRSPHDNEVLFQPSSMALLILSPPIMLLTPWKKKRKATLIPLPECRE
jgi:dihydroorotase